MVRLNGSILKYVKHLILHTYISKITGIATCISLSFRERQSTETVVLPQVYHLYFKVHIYHIWTPKNIYFHYKKNLINLKRITKFLFDSGTLSFCSIPELWLFQQHSCCLSHEGRASTPRHWPRFTSGCSSAPSSPARWWQFNCGIAGIQYQCPIVGPVPTAELHRPWWGSNGAF